MKKLSGKQKLTVVVLVVVALAAAAIIAWRLRPVTKTASGTIVYSTNEPSEAKPDKSYTWKGKPEDPKKIIIPSLGIDGYIQNVGVDQNKEIAVPDNIHIAGWFDQTVRPGQKGLSIIDGHVDGQKSDGIFTSLSDIEPGSEIRIEFGNGSTKSFTALATNTVDADKAPSVLFSQDPTVSNQLNLITCTGSFNESTKRYEKRVIVTSKLVP